MLWNRYIDHFYSLAVEAGFYVGVGRVIGVFVKLSNVHRDKYLDGWPRCLTLWKARQTLLIYPLTWSSGFLLHSSRRPAFLSGAFACAIWVENVPSSMLKMCGFTSFCTCAKPHPGICSSLIYSTVSNDSVSGQRMS